MHPGYGKWLENILDRGPERASEFKGRAPRELGPRSLLRPEQRHHARVNFLKHRSYHITFLFNTLQGLSTVQNP